MTNNSTKDLSPDHILCPTNDKLKYLQTFVTRRYQNWCVILKYVLKWMAVVFFLPPVRPLELIQWGIFGAQCVGFFSSADSKLAYSILWDFHSAHFLSLSLFQQQVIMHCPPTSCFASVWYLHGSSECMCVAWEKLCTVYTTNMLLNQEYFYFFSIFCSHDIVWKLKEWREW